MDEASLENVASTRLRKRIVPQPISPKEVKRRCAINPSSAEHGESLITDTSAGEVDCKSELPLPFSLEHPVLRLRHRSNSNSGTNGSSDDLDFQFAHTPRSDVRRVDNVNALRELLQAAVDRSMENVQKWLRQPRAVWIAEMVDELSPAQREKLTKRHRRLQETSVPPDDFGRRWMLRSDFASVVVNLWLEDKELDDVIARAEKLGHMEDNLVGGCILEGELLKDFARAENVDFETLLSMIKKMCAPEKTVPVYKVLAENCFRQGQTYKMPISELTPCDGQGSLNTTWTYGPGGPCPIELVDDFYECVTDALKTCQASVELNPRMYLIWKFPHYVTSYHQDTHVPPHCTIYNQVSGVSSFHFLPLLVGLYVTYVGRKDVNMLNSVMKELDQRRIGSLATIGPGQMALILPNGSHGVWVPSPGLNPTIPKFQTSLIRATELYVKPALDMLIPLMRLPSWNCVIEHSPEDIKELSQFSAAQRELCSRMALSKQDWLWLMKMTWKDWMENDNTISSDSDSDDSVC